MRKTQILLSTLLGLLLLVGGKTGFAESERDDEIVAPSTAAPLLVYNLETIELKGTTRLTSEQISEQLALKPGTPLNDALVVSIRQKLLGLGVFRSVLPSIARGSKPGLAKLVISVEDDDTVLGDWAWGGRVGVTLGESQAAMASLNSPPLGYQADLISRNLFGALHRGRVHFDIDAEGNLRTGGVAYGLPRWTVEGATFDAEFNVVDPRRRYLNAMGFGAKGQGLWTQALGNYQDLYYGPAIYMNSLDNYEVPFFPSSVAGAKFGYLYESRLLKFFPSAGHRLSAAAIVAPLQFSESILELGAAKTFVWFGENLAFTSELQTLIVGSKNTSLRAEGRFDVPLAWDAPANSDTGAFLRLRAGRDSSDESSWGGTAAILGMRYHSSGFIAELSVQITKSPSRLTEELSGSTPQRRGND